MKRQLDSKIETNLLAEDLWISQINKDCTGQQAFLAVRNDRVDIYHKGGKLFGYDKNGFKTHVKYASVISSSNKDYLTEKELSAQRLISDFEMNYLRIKENCANYSGVEALGVSDIYHRHSYLSDSNVVVLDIEVSLDAVEKERKQDRIDILLFNRSTKTLQFVEAKHFSNPDIWSTDSPKVLGQIARYQEQINLRKSEILSAYSEYVQIINRVFGITLPEPIGIDPKPTLLIFGFDSNQRSGRLKGLITDNSHYAGIKCYPIGNIKKLKPENLWNANAIVEKK